MVKKRKKNTEILDLHSERKNDFYSYEAKRKIIENHYMVSHF